MRKRKRKNPPVYQAGAVILTAAVFAAAAVGTVKFLPYAQPVLKNAAVASVMTVQPQQAMELLEKRFYTQLYLQREESPQPAPVKKELEQPKQEDRLPQPQKEPAQREEKPQTQPETKRKTPVEIPEEYQGPIIEENMSAQAREGIIAYGQGLVRNSSNFSDGEVQSFLSQPDSLALDSQGPQVLIVHTHATESFEPFDADTYDTRNTWRSTNNEENMVAVGDVVAENIEKWGIKVLHDTTLHDYPSYNGSYDRSAETIRRYLEEYPSIKVVLDVHRDAIQREQTLVKPVVTINGEKAAQLMIIAGCDDGTMNMPNWRENLRFAAGIQNQMETMYPGLTRPVFFCYRKYNMDLTTGSLLIEFGSHGNTLEEVLRTGEMAGDAIGQYLAGKVVK